MHRLPSLLSLRHTSSSILRTSSLTSQHITSSYSHQSLSSHRSCIQHIIRTFATTATPVSTSTSTATSTSTPTSTATPAPTATSAATSTSTSTSTSASTPPKKKTIRQKRLGKLHRKILKADAEMVFPEYKRSVQFPNAIFKMVKSGKPLLPNEVVFRVPLNYNKLMIRYYLEEIYKVKVKQVNTMVYLGSQRRTMAGKSYKRPDYKKAIVTLTEPFTYPSNQALRTYNDNIKKQNAPRQTNVVTKTA